MGEGYITEVATRSDYQKWLYENGKGSLVGSSLQPIECTLLRDDIAWDV